MIVRKVMLLGEMAVGGTSIANRLAFDRFGESYKSTIGTDIYVYDVEAPPGDKPFRFLIWDTDGSFQDAMFRSHYMRGAHAAIIVGDLTPRKTLESQLRLTQKFSEELPGRHFSAVLKKNDLRDEIPEDDDWVPEGLRWPFSPVIETSAKSGHNIRQTFQDAAETIARRDL